MIAVRRWWNQLAGMPARTLIAALSRGHLQHDYAGIRIIIIDQESNTRADDLFERTCAALAFCLSIAPAAFTTLRKDLRQILIVEKPAKRPYNRFQLAAVPDVSIPLKASTPCYAAWLLQVSGSVHGETEAAARADQLLRMLETHTRDATAVCLARVLSHCS